MKPKYNSKVGTIHRTVNANFSAHYNKLLSSTQMICVRMLKITACTDIVTDTTKLRHSPKTKNKTKPPYDIVSMQMIGTIT